jgi:hypothetical protein
MLTSARVGLAVDVLAKCLPSTRASLQTEFPGARDAGRLCNLVHALFELARPGQSELG